MSIEPDRIPSYAEREKWFKMFPVDGEGRSTSKVAYRVIKTFFLNRNKSFSPEELSDKLYHSKILIKDMCRQLEMIEIIKQNPPGSENYQYYLDSPNVEFQAKVEAALIDFPQSEWYLRTPYSPSNPCTD